MKDNRIVYEGMRTPWGSAQTANVLAPGIGIVSTAGHGGLKLSDYYALDSEYQRGTR